jgi:hypothetical protein
MYPRAVTCCRVRAPRRRPESSLLSPPHPPPSRAQARVDRFRQFVLSQSHRPIVVVGHANFFRSLTHESHYMGNCQVMSWAP